jgi:hypothetical protein
MNFLVSMPLTSGKCLCYPPDTGWISPHITSGHDNEEKDLTALVVHPVLFFLLLYVHYDDTVGKLTTISIYNLCTSDSCTKIMLY